MKYAAIHKLSLSILIFISASLALAASKQINLSSQDVAAVVRKSVVVIRCLRSDGTSMLGSGFFIDGVGLLTTNAHVVAQCTDLVVTDELSKEPILARVLLSDDERDIAILQVSGKGHTPLKLAASPSLLKQGQQVYAVGHPEGLEYTISEGIISAFREFPSRRLIQTTAPISPGSSGGPLVDTRGIVVGMTTLFLKEGQNLNFAVPSDAILEALTRAKALRVGQELPVMSSLTAARVVRLFRKQKQFDIAKKILKSALPADPTNLNLLLEEAELAWDENRLEDSEAVVRKMLELDPNFAPAHQCLGAILIRKGDIVTGCEEERRSLELNPDEMYRAYANALLFKCEITKRKTMTPEQFRIHVANVALPYLEAALTWRENADQPVIHTDGAISLKIIGRTQEANAEARRVLKMATVSDKERNLLKQYGLPETEIYVVSTAQHELYKQAGIPVLIGIVVNRSIETASRIRILVECSESGKLVGTGTGYVQPQNLPAGESGSFEIWVKGPAQGQAGQMTCKTEIADFLMGEFPW